MEGTSMKTKKTLLAATLGAAILTAGPQAVAQEMTFFDRIWCAGGTYYPMAGLLAQVISNHQARTCTKGSGCGMEGGCDCAISSWFRGKCELYKI